MRDEWRAARLVAAYSVRESLRKRVFTVVLLLTAVFVVLFTIACAVVFPRVDQVVPAGAELVGRPLAVATLLGLAMFGTLFLGAVLAVFLTLGAVRGDAESGLLAPLLVRPISRRALLAGRFLAAGSVCSGYVLALYAVTVVVVRITGGSWPGTIVGPGLALAGAVLVVVALSLLGSVFLSAVANGIMVLMAFGAGLVAGLMSTIGDALSSSSLQDIAHVLALAIPFEALYQAGLHAVLTGQGGVAGAILRLGPFGVSRGGGPLLVVWAAVWVLGAGLLALRGFARRDV